MSYHSPQSAFSRPLADYPQPVSARTDYEACLAIPDSSGQWDKERLYLHNLSRSRRFEQYMQTLIERTGLENLRFLTGEVWGFCRPHDYKQESIRPWASVDLYTELSGQTLVEAKASLDQLIGWITEHTRACAQGEESDFVFEGFVYPEDLYENLDRISPQDDPGNDRFGEEGDSPECLLWVLKQLVVVMDYALQHEHRVFYETRGELSRAQLIAKGVDVPPYPYPPVRTPRHGPADSQQYVFSVSSQECSLAIQNKRQYDICAMIAAESRQKNTADEAQRYLINTSRDFTFEKLIEALIARTGWDEDLRYFSGQAWGFSFSREDTPPDSEYVTVDLVSGLHANSYYIIDQLLAWIDEHTRLCAQQPELDFVFADWLTPQAFLEQLPQLVPTPTPYRAAFGGEGDAPACLYRFLQQLSIIMRYANQHKMAVFYETWRELKRDELSD